VGDWRGFEVGGRLVVVAGADAGTLGAVTSLAHAGARVRVLTEDASPALEDLAARGRLELVIDGDLPAALHDASFVVLGTEDPGRSAAILTAAAERNLAVCRLHPADAGRNETQDTRTERSADTAGGRVILVGGGPGDPGLLTVAGLQAIKDADVIAADRLAPLAALEQARDDVELIDVGKIPRGRQAEQRSIEDLLVDRARAGKLVVRFKGGDSFVFGRGGEEWQACAAAGIPVTVIPGVTSASAAPAAAGIPLTHRTLSQGFTVVTGHVPPDDPRSTVDWRAIAATGTTLVIMMGMANLAAIAKELVAGGLPADTPAAVVQDGTLPSMQTVRATLAEIADRSAEAGLGAPATVVIGAVAGFRPDQPSD
jgi:uroporphyrin-III C-methyltransferase